MAAEALPELDARRGKVEALTQIGSDLFGHAGRRIHLEFAELECEARGRIPGVPETNTMSPGRPPDRNIVAGRGAWPRICTLMQSGPDVVSPPTSATSCLRASSLKPRANPASQAGSAFVSVSASSAHAGFAPIAAMSLRFTANARWPIDSGGKCARK